MNKNNDNTIFIFCAPYPKYKNQPKDYSQSELSTCPLCENKMWLSIKKKQIIKTASELKKDIFLSCYDCFEDFAKKINLYL